MNIVQHFYLFIVFVFIGGFLKTAQAVIVDGLPNPVSHAYTVAVLDLAARYGAQEPCNWEEHEANINSVYDEHNMAAPLSMNEWVDQLCVLAEEMSKSMTDDQDIDTSGIVHDHNFVKFCRMLAASMLFQINYEKYIKSWKEHSRLSSLLEEHRQESFALLGKIQGRFEHQAYAQSLQTHYYSIHALNIQTASAYYLGYHHLSCYSIKLILQVLVKGYFHWNIIEQRQVVGLGREDFCPDSDQRFEEDDGELHSQNDVHEIGMRRGKLSCCYKVCKTLKMVAQDRAFEEALWEDINKRIREFDGVGFVYSPIVLAGLAASSEDTANFLASCVLQNFEKMHSHFIYLIFSNPLTCIKQEALFAFAQHFSEEVAKEQASGWVHQQAEAVAWKNILGQ